MTLWHVEVKCLNQHTAHVQYSLCPFVFSHTHAHTHTPFAFEYTQSQIRILNYYHMVTIVRAANRGKTAQTTEKWEPAVQHNKKPQGDERREGRDTENRATRRQPITEDDNDDGRVSHLYMRSMSISGSSWNSLIFTVSDKILLRFLRSSST